MNKKIMFFGILAVFIIVSISLASAYTSSEKPVKKESPLFRLRTRQAINDKAEEIKDNIETNYINDKIFLIPYLLFRGDNIENKQDSLIGTSGLLCFKIQTSFPTCIFWHTCYQCDLFS